MPSVVKSASTNKTYFSPPFAVSRQNLFNTSDEICSRDFEHFGEFENCGEGRIVLPTLEQADVLRVVPTFERKRFLSEMTLQAELPQDSSKRSFLWRRLLCSSWHLHAGVCDGSINTSTKYSILAVCSAVQEQRYGWFRDNSIFRPYRVQKRIGRCRRP